MFVVYLGQVSGDAIGRRVGGVENYKLRPAMAATRKEPSPYTCFLLRFAVPKRIASIRGSGAHKHYDASLAAVSLFRS